MIKNYIKRFLNTLKELIKEIPEDYEVIRKRNEMNRKKINEEYERFKQNR